MPNDLPLYPYSAKEARTHGELPAWRESFRENCACAGTIEISIREHFDGMHLKDGAVEWAVKQYGYKRVEHVLANTVQILPYGLRRILRTAAQRALFPLQAGTRSAARRKRHKPPTRAQRRGSALLMPAPPAFSAVCASVPPALHR